MTRRTPFSALAALSAAASLLLASTGCAATTAPATPDAVRAAECLRNGDFETAFSIVDSALAETPDRADLYVLRAQTYWRLNRVQKAEADLESALKHGLKKGPYHILRAQIRMYERNYKAAAAEAGAAEKEMPASPLPARMKMDAIARGKAVGDRALTLEKALSAEKNRARRETLAVALAKLNYYGRNRPADAIALLEKETQAAPESLLAADTLAWMRMMVWLPALRNTEQAAAIARENLKKHPDNPLFLDTAAAAESCAGNAKQALELLEKSFLQAKNLTHGNPALIPLLKKDFEQKKNRFSAGKPYAEPRGCVRFLWLLEQIRESSAHR